MSAQQVLNKPIRTGGHYGAMKAHAQGDKKFKNSEVVHEKK